MIHKALLAAVLLVPLTATADRSTVHLLNEAWPHIPVTQVGDLGHGIGVVFSPDLSVEGNCRFYTALGFACFQDADWNRVLDDIRTHNIFHPGNRIRTLILETHGTNGNGLKLQRSYDPKADRSYISVGALQERLDPDGIRYIIISACNSGRLLRPSIYRSLDPNTGDKLFLPATCGIVDASADFNPHRSRIIVATPAESHIESTLAAKVSELAPATRRVLEAASKSAGIKPPRDFAVSDLMMQMLLRDDSLALTTGGYVDDLSAVVKPDQASENLFLSFRHLVDSVAAQDARRLPPPAAPRPAAKKWRPAARKTRTGIAK